MQTTYPNIHDSPFYLHTKKATYHSVILLEHESNLTTVTKKRKSNFITLSHAHLNGLFTSFSDISKILDDARLHPSAPPTPRRRRRRRRSGISLEKFDSARPPTTLHTAARKINRVSPGTFHC